MSNSLKETENSSMVRTPDSPHLVLVLVDCPEVNGLYTYQFWPEQAVQPGDILSVPFGSQVLGGIAIQLTSVIPNDLTLEQIKFIEDVVTRGFFSPTYGPLLQRVADYYCASLMTVIRAALPPGLLGRSQRRIRLKTEEMPQGVELFCSAPGLKVLRLLKTSKTGDYSYRYLQQKLGSQTLRLGLKDLQKRGWVESHFVDPKSPQAQSRRAVTLSYAVDVPPLTEKQQEVLTVLRHQGGECWLSELMALVPCSLGVIENLAAKGLVVIAAKEQLRLLAHPDMPRDRPQHLTPAQQQALAVLQPLTGFHIALLHGVTGSGKTEVYLQAIAPILNAGQSVLILVPEIGLAPQLTDRFRARFGDKVLVYHSALSEGERYDTWRKMLAASGQIVIGTRSAVFVPLTNLGLIILDEEHDSSFKQQQLNPPYHARTVAQWRAELENCPLILGSATPSLETWHQIHHAPAFPPVHYLTLPERVNTRPLPAVTLVDMREELKAGNRSIFSRQLQTALAQLTPPNQAILFISRRGHSTFVSCRSCGFVLECPHCDVSLSYHYTKESSPLLRCHYCNYSCHQPRFCPSCQSPYLKFFGSGTQKVTETLTEDFPHLRWLRFDSDTTRKKGEHRRLLDQFRRGEADILVGTQMLTKGLDVAQVVLVGVVAADSLLHFADYRATERAFQTLTQVAGRAGRGEEPGQILIQSYSPQHPVLQAVKHHHYQEFIERELPQRQAMNYPPYGHLILLRLSSLDAQLVEKTAITLAQLCQTQIGSPAEILGPAPATIMRIAERYRWHIVLKFPLHQITLPDWELLRSHCPPSVNLTIDIDPLFID